MHVNTIRYDKDIQAIAAMRVGIEVCNVRVGITVRRDVRAWSSRTLHCLLIAPTSMVSGSIHTPKHSLGIVRRFHPTLSHHVLLHWLCLDILIGCARGR